MIDWSAESLRALAPPPRAGWWEWLCEHLVMPTGQRFDARRGRMWRRWFRLVEARLTLTPTAADPAAHRCEQLWIVGAAQIYKTAFLHACLLASVGLSPRKQALYMARIQDLKLARRTKLERQVLAMPPLEQLLPRSEAARDSALASDAWMIGAALWFWCCGCVADDWRAQDFPFMALDEFERYPLDVEGYGDPIDNGLVRQRTHPRSRLMLGTTSPGSVPGHGWRRLCGGTHERLLVVCPDCGGWFDLVGSRVTVATGDLAKTSPSAITAERLGRYPCPWCGVLHADPAIRAAIDRAIDADRWIAGTWAMDEAHPTGAWRPLCGLDDRGQPREQPTAPTSTIRSAWASALYSPDVTLDAFAAATAHALKGTERNLLATVNNDWAEPYVRALRDTAADADSIRATAASADDHRRGMCPIDAWKVVLFFDQQGNTLDTAWYPWLAGAITVSGELWLIDAGAARPDAHHRTGDSAADAIARRRWLVGGRERGADLIVRDSANGNLKFEHYLWAAADPQTRLLTYGDPRLADGIPWSEVIDKPDSRRRTSKPAGVREYRVAPHHWRTATWDRLRRLRDGLPPIRIPGDFPDFALRSFTSEEQIIERRRVAGGWRDCLIWRPRLIQETNDTTSQRTDTHWWDGLVNLVVADDLLRKRIAPIADATPEPTEPGGDRWDSNLDTSW